MKTRFSTILVLLTIASVMLTACGSASAATQSASQGLSTATRLAVGTLKLEGTSNAVTASQASQLLTLWQAYQSLNGSDTTSQVELDALVKQIESTLTSEQLKAIDAMELTEQSVSEVLQSVGGSPSANAPASTPSSSAQSQSAQPGGQGGMPPGDAGNPMSDITNGLTTQSTPVATQTTANTASSQVNQILLQALIQMLQTRSQATG